MKKFIWLSYDLGIQGDYEGLYAWLDEHNALECGESLAGLNYEFNDDLITSLKNELKSDFDINNKTRIYVIYKDTDSNKVKGKFIFGKRKNSPWTGYSLREVEEEDYDG